MKILSQQKTERLIKLMPGDTIVLSYTEMGSLSPPTVVAKQEIGGAMIIDETVIFDVEPGDFGINRKGIGGAFLEQEEK